MHASTDLLTAPRPYHLSRYRRDRERFALDVVLRVVNSVRVLEFRLDPGID